MKFKEMFIDKLGEPDSMQKLDEYLETISAEYELDNTYCEKPPHTPKRDVSRAQK